MICINDVNLGENLEYNKIKTEISKEFIIL